MLSIRRQNGNFIFNFVSRVKAWCLVFTSDPAARVSDCRSSRVTRACAFDTEVANVYGDTDYQLDCLFPQFASLIWYSDYHTAGSFFLTPIQIRIMAQKLVYGHKDNPQPTGRLPFAGAVSRDASQKIRPYRTRWPNRTPRKYLFAHRKISHSHCFW